MKIYREIVRNTAMGAQSVDNIIGYIDCEKMKNLVLSQKETMEEFYQKAKSELSEKELEDAQSNPVQRMMLKAATIWASKACKSASTNSTATALTFPTLPKTL